MSPVAEIRAGPSDAAPLVGGEKKGKVAPLKSNTNSVDPQTPDYSPPPRNSLGDCCEVCVVI